MSQAVADYSTISVVIHPRERRVLAFEGCAVHTIQDPRGVWLDEWDVAEALGLRGNALTNAFVAVPDQHFRAVALGDHEMPAHVSPHGALLMAATAGTARAERFRGWIGTELLQPAGGPRRSRRKASPAAKPQAAPVSRRVRHLAVITGGRDASGA